MQGIVLENLVILYVKKNVPMGKSFKEIQAALATMRRKDVENLLIKAMRDSDSFYQYVWVNHLDKEAGEAQVFEQYKAEIKALLKKGYRGASLELRAANMIAACKKKLDAFIKVCKAKDKAVELGLYVAEHPATDYEGHSGTCYTKYDFEYYMLFKKIRSLYQALHHDIQYEYTERLQKMLTQLKKHFRHLDYVYDLPDEL
ncbi:MAG: hypothetical protein EAY75_00125 [Bacteroidetes bacterium]|nr:MAG: hypothetical protein EAY75_00125 [Bacteroidota bacterium]